MVGKTTKYINLRKNHSFNIFGVSFQRFYHSLVLGLLSLVLDHHLEPPGHAVGQLLQVFLGGAQDLYDVPGGPQGQVHSGRNGVSVVALTPQGQYPHFIFNVDIFYFHLLKL